MFILRGFTIGERFVTRIQLARELLIANLRVASSGSAQALAWQILKEKSALWLRVAGLGEPNRYATIFLRKSILNTPRTAGEPQARAKLGRDTRCRSTSWAAGRW